LTRLEITPMGQVVLSRSEVERVFSRVRDKRDWHRVAQRLAVFNKLARPAGVKLSVRSRRGEVIVLYESPQALQNFLAALTARSGHMQAAFAEVVGARAGETAARGSVPAGVPRRQAAMLRGALSRDLGVFSELPLDELWVDAGNAVRRPVLEEICAALPASIVLTGDGGSGKTALLQRLLARWGSAPERLRRFPPVYVAAKHLRFEWTGFELPWSALPGIEPAEAERVRAAFAEGRLLLLLDGINDAPILTDFNHPAVQSFWAAAARNACLLTTLPEHYDTHIKAGPLPALFAAGLRRVEMPAWGEDDYARLFELLAQACVKSPSRSLRSLGGHLGRVSTGAWKTGWDLLRWTPLCGHACANFVASHEGRKLPRNEYELLEHMFTYHLRHERGKGGSPLFQDAVESFLSKLAWQAYVDGLAGQWYVVSFDTASRVLRENFPLLTAEQQTEILSAVVQLPFIERENGSLCFNSHFSDFLVAREIIQTMVAGNFQRLRQVLAFPWSYANMSRTLFQGIRCLEPEQRKRYLRTCETLFRMIWQEFLRDRSFRQEVAMAYVLQPLGFLDLPEVTEVFERVYETAEGDSEFVAMSCGVGFGWHGDQDGVRRYVERLRKSAKAARFNLQFYLFYRRTDRLRLDIENFTPELIRDWSATCDWLLDAATRQDPDFRPLRLLYAFTLGNFLKAMGPAPFIAHNGSTPKALARRARLVEVLDFWSESREHRDDMVLQAQVKDIRRLAAGHFLVGGKRNGTKKANPKPPITALR